MLVDVCHVRVSVVVAHGYMVNMVIIAFSRTPEICGALLVLEINNIVLLTGRQYREPEGVCSIAVKEPP